MDIDPGTPEERLRKAAAWAHDDNRPLLASACLDGADEIERLRALVEPIPVNLPFQRPPSCEHDPGDGDAFICPHGCNRAQRRGSHAEVEAPSGHQHGGSREAPRPLPEID